MRKHDQLIELLKYVRSIVDTPNTDLCWSRYNDLAYFFAPTGSLQEISISNGWGEEFIEVSEAIDKLIT